MKKARILIVDDRPTHVAPLVDTLKIRGYEVETVGDGTQALERLKRTRFQLILLDLVLPRLSGFEILRQLKDSKTLSQIPVIVITAMSGSDDAHSARLYGADYVLFKPFQLTKTLDVIERSLRAHSSSLLTIP